VGEGSPEPEEGVEEAPPRVPLLTLSDLECDIDALSEERRLETEAEAHGEVEYSVKEGVKDIWMTMSMGIAGAAEGGMLVAEGLKLLGSSAPRMRSLFISEHSMVVRGGQTRGKHLDTGRIMRLQTTPPWQKPRIWESRTPGRAVDAAVALALDESGSMNGIRSYVACRLAAGIATTLERARIPVEVVGYSAIGSSSHRNMRTNPAVFNVIKSFEEPRLAPYKCVPHLGDNNSDPDVLRLLGERLLARREPKKILLFLSDGELESKGVIVFGFGMEADLSQYFTNPNNHVTVDSKHLTDLPRIMLKKLESILV
jgi:hypothetical protein